MEKYDPKQDPANPNNIKNFYMQDIFTYEIEYKDKTNMTQTEYVPYHNTMITFLSEIIARNGKDRIISVKEIKTTIKINKETRNETIA